jgi:hypothetical protein
MGIELYLALEKIFTNNSSYQKKKCETSKITQYTCIIKSNYIDIKLNNDCWFFYKGYAIKVFNRSTLIACKTSVMALRKYYSNRIMKP